MWEVEVMMHTESPEGILTGPELRRRFVAFFEERLGTELPSASLVPKNDPTVLLTVAGMQQMIPYFVGVEQPPTPRLCSVQKCFRTVDIDEVGDESHLTFFEMLGNFSVGDYFKREAIGWAWELLTKGYGLPAERLWVTVYPKDDEARGIWRDEIGLPAERITVTATPEKDNWWGPVGPTGPCGPCSEIYYDFGYTEGRTGDQPGDDGGRFLEVWNLVFMEFNRNEDGTDTPLPRKNIDTGMGLERLTMVIQGKKSVYDTDLYQPIIARAEELTGTKYGVDSKTDRSLRVIADHSRSITFLIGDGVLPDNEGRGYILRRILRRAVRYGRLLGLDRLFLTETAGVVIEQMRDQYPELVERRERIFQVIRHEEESFGRTLTRGLSRFATLVAGIKTAGKTTVPGAEVFRLYDTYGFPFDLTVELANEAGLEVERAEFDQAMEGQRALSREASHFGKQSHRDLETYAGLKLPPTEFLGYDQDRAQGSILAIIGANGPQEVADTGDEVEIVLDRTPFYAESGGQVGDTGLLASGAGQFGVTDTQRPVAGITGHRGKVEAGQFRVGDTVEATIDSERRADIRRNHTATHILHRALRLVLGTHAQQAGSLVAPDRLRFDFTHQQALTADELRRVGAIASEAVLANDRVYADVMDQQAALATGAMALFGEKYGDQVRVVTIEDFSKELCGGTHVTATGEIGPIVITGEAGVAAGVRRLEALTGRSALAYLGQVQSATDALFAQFRTRVPEQLPPHVEGLRGRIRELEREVERLKGELAGGQAGNLLANVREIAGVKVLATRVDVPDAGALSQLGDRLRDSLGAGVIVLGAVTNERPALLTIVTPDLVARGLKAGDILGETARALGGRGGGRPDRAQGGGGDPTKLDSALDAVPTIVERVLNAGS
jgi:alanyl-tRNA synthetase